MKEDFAEWWKNKPKYRVFNCKLSDAEAAQIASGLSKAEWVRARLIGERND